MIRTQRRASLVAIARRITIPERQYVSPSPALSLPSSCPSWTNCRVNIPRFARLALCSFYMIDKQAPVENINTSSDIKAIDSDVVRMIYRRSTLSCLRYPSAGTHTQQCRMRCRHHVSHRDKQHAAGYSFLFLLFPRLDATIDSALLIPLQTRSSEMPRLAPGLADYLLMIH